MTLARDWQLGESCMVSKGATHPATVTKIGRKCVTVTTVHGYEYQFDRQTRAFHGVNYGHTPQLMTPAEHERAQIQAETARALAACATVDKLSGLTVEQLRRLTVILQDPAGTL